MNRFSDASLRGGIPKTNKMMKTYITPNTECTEMRFMTAILLESGEGMLNDAHGTGGSNAAPERKVF